MKIPKWNSLTPLCCHTHSLNQKTVSIYLYLAMLGRISLLLLNFYIQNVQVYSTRNDFKKRISRRKKKTKFEQKEIPSIVSFYMSLVWFLFFHAKNSGSEFLWLFIGKLIDAHLECCLTFGKFCIVIKNLFDIFLENYKTFSILVSFVALLVLGLKFDKLH